MADVTQGLPPLFVGRYPGAPIQGPQPAPAPPQFVSRQDRNAHGTTSGAVPVFQPLAPAVSATPLDTAALNAATQGAPVAPAVPAAAAIVPANAAAASAVSPTPGVGNPLPPNMQPGGVGLPSGPVAGGTAATQRLPAYGGSAAAQPYDPNAVGSWQKYQLTQDHTLFDPFGRGDGTPGSIGGPLPGGGAMVNGHFVDPRDAIALGFKQQLAYQQAASNNLLGAIGRSNGLAATTHALAGTVGANNFAGVQGQGVDALNAATAGITSAGIGANASMYGADQATARTGLEVGEQHFKAATDSVPLGTVVGADPVSHMAVPLTTYGQRPSQAGGMPEAYSPTRTTPLPAGLKVGAKSVRADGTYSAGGKTVTIKNGQVTGIE